MANTFKIPRALLPVTYFFLGVFSVTAQAVMSREFLVVVNGNEPVLGVLFFAWLLGIFTGAAFGAGSAERALNPARRFALACLVAVPLLPIAITAVRFLYTLTGTAAGAYIPFMKVFPAAGLLLGPIGFFVGFTFPLAARVHTQACRSDSAGVKKISQIYILEALGFLVGGTLYTFRPVGWTNAYSICAVVLLPLTLCCLVLSARCGYQKTRGAAVVLLVGVLSLLLPPVNRALEKITLERRWRSVSNLPLVYTTDSRYRHIAVARLADQYYLYLNNKYAAVFPAPEENLILAAHLLCQHPTAKKILLIGNALTGPVKQLPAYDIDKLVALEIDRVLVDTVLRFRPDIKTITARDERLHFPIEDGRRYVKKAALKNERFDLVYLNPPEPSTLLANRYYTREFFLDLAKILPDRGVVALAVTAPENYTGGLVGQYTASIYRTLASVFPVTVVTPGNPGFIFASRRPGTVSADPDLLAERYAAFGMEPKELSMIFTSLYPPGKAAFMAAALQNRRDVPVNRDGRPTATFYYGKIVGWYAGSTPTGLWDTIESAGVEIFLGLVFILFALRLVYLKRAKSAGRGSRALKFHTLAAVFCCGLAGMTLELTILYTYQVVVGHVYHMVGFIIGLFMTGLPLGAVLANVLLARLSPGSRRPVVVALVLLQTALAGLGLAVSRLVTVSFDSVVAYQVVIFILTAAVGLVVGTVFPLAVHLHLGGRQKSAYTAGRVDAADHLGAALGALSMGTALLPLLGVFGVCLLLAVLLMLSSALLLSTPG